MDPDTEILVDFPPFFRIYRSGRVERYMGTETVPAGVDPATGVLSKDVTIDAVTGVSARLYLPEITTGALNHRKKEKLPILVYYHGGGFCVASAFSPFYHSYLNSLVSGAGVVAVSVDYRLAPENLLPAAYDDSWAALKWVLSSGDPWLAEYGDPDRVFLGGDSSGANITHDVLMRIGKKEEEMGEVEGMLLVDPYFWGTEPIASETRNPYVRSFFEKVWLLVSQPGANFEDPRINPMAEGAPSLAGLGCRRALVCVAGADPLAERGRAYCEALRRSGWGGEVEMVVSEGEGHIFHLQKPECEKAKELMERVVAFLLGVQDEATRCYSVLNLSSDSGFRVSSEKNHGHIALKIPTETECYCGRRASSCKGDDKSIKKAHKGDAGVNSSCAELRDELWEIGREKMKIGVAGVLIGFSCLLLFLLLKMV